VSSDNAVSVIAGNAAITIGAGTIQDSSMSELFPVPAWGQTFGVAPIPGNYADGYSLKIGSGLYTASVMVTVGGASPQMYTVQPNTVQLIAVRGNFATSITSNVPIQVCYVGAYNVSGISTHSFGK